MYSVIESGSIWTAMATTALITAIAFIAGYQMGKKFWRGD